MNIPFIDLQEEEAIPYLDCRCLIPQTIFVSCPDVNFIASPPSMVAAGSVVAAVQGLYLKTQDASLSSQNLTNFLSQVIRSDPVCNFSKNPFIQAVWMLPMKYLAQTNCMFPGLLEGLSGADRVSAGAEPAAGSAAQRHHGTQARGRGGGPVMHSHRREGRKHLKRPCGTLTLSVEEKLWAQSRVGGPCAVTETRHTRQLSSATAQPMDCLPCNKKKNPGHISCQCPLPSWEKKKNATEMYERKSGMTNE